MMFTNKRIKDKYTIIRQLNESKMASTFLAEDDKREKYILKALSLKGIEDWKTLQLFEREGRILEKLNHPRIPQYQETFSEEIEEDTLYFLVYQYIDGLSLRDYLKTNDCFTYEETEALMIQTLEILQYVHNHVPPVVHRDINPKNLILTPDGDIFLVDFGACKDLLSRGDKSDKTTFVGTYGYVPLEQMTGDAEPQSDLYALGMTAINLLTGKSPADFPMKEMKPDYLAGTEMNRLDRIINTLIEPDLNKRLPSADQAIKLIKNRVLPVKVSVNSGQKAVGFSQRTGKVAVVNGNEGSTLICSTDSGTGFRSSVLNLILKTWLKNPWILIILVGIITSGAAVLPLIILSLVPQIKAAARKELAYISDTKVSIDKKRLKVSNQIDHLPIKRISQVDVFPKKRGKKFDLQVNLELKNGPTRSFLLPNLTEEEADAASGFLVDHINQS